MSAGRICVRSVDTASMGESVLDAARRMHARNVGSLVVVDNEQRPLGLLTDRDLVVRVLAESRDPNETMVSQVMTRPPQSVREDMPIEEALGLMRCGPYRRLPVVGRDGRLVGILSLDDILDLLVEEFGEIGRLLHKESPQSLAEAID
ncbi:MAG TPA: CBS domain-containing protein [Planctomycetaceae bacterium]|nr:CBS domain-containing protein [Planctomycetaceae bacterium]